ncbi:hypothetical protein ACFYRN_25190 [Streptomyces sp. NPDC005227]|uniref:hypothetical protein n=1 Tax=Streptomyces sp. NPDC005227 TaxID=3364707 RepID=UPI00369B7DBE
MTHDYADSKDDREQALMRENRGLRALAALLTERLEDLQGANEGAYRELAAATGGPRFDPAQLFPAEPPRPLGHLPRPFLPRRPQ